jgi:hypothetical protein
LCPVGAEVVTLAHEPLVDGHVGRVRHVLPDPPGVPPAERAALPLRNGLVTLKKRSSDVTTRVSTFERDLFRNLRSLTNASSFVQGVKKCFNNGTPHLMSARL